MKLYHASINVMPEKMVVKGVNPSTYYPNATVAIDAKRPTKAPARLTALYCADSEEFAVYYLVVQGVDLNDINLYEVEVKEYHTAPFSITHVVESRIKKGEDITVLVDEYWTPSRNWNYVEYLTTEFEVKKAIDLPKLNQILLCEKTLQDSELATSIS